ncbi:hypothetical protein CDAR_27901 [Caerostris darwini]|uniref:Uncharacterized protein n=1 Tax=Caerostris darwini TaxID=1538125 RepID=A0AAV4RA75_9ARAC|nr:hypothetical protein CDAR_27901 [Caerostris darwini]
MDGKENFWGPLSFWIFPAWMVGQKKKSPPYYRKGSALASEIKTYDQSGKSVRNGARKNTFVSDRRRINCCGADKKTVKVKNSFCVGCCKGWAQGWMMVSPGGRQERLIFIEGICIRCLRYWFFVEGSHSPMFLSETF